MSARVSSTLFVCSALVASAIVPAGTALAQPGITPPGQVAPKPYPPAAPYEPAPTAPHGPSPEYTAPYYGPTEPYPLAAPVPEGRQGFTIGLGLGLGSLESSEGQLPCAGCEGEPPTVMLDIHFGTMLNPKLSIALEYWRQSRALDSNGDSRLNQDMLMGSLQYWMSPRLWFKGGIGLASLSMQYDDGLGQQMENIGDGGAMMLGLGYEIMHSNSFGLDVQGKYGVGFYDDEVRDDFETWSLALGVNWY